jgi:hypothetical protein
MIIAVGHDERLTPVEERAWQKCVRGLAGMGCNMSDIDEVIGTLNIAWQLLIALDPQALARRLGGHHAE